MSSYIHIINARLKVVDIRMDNQFQWVDFYQEFANNQRWKRFWSFLEIVGTYQRRSKEYCSYCTYEPFQRYFQYCGSDSWRCYHSGWFSGIQWRITSAGSVFHLEVTSCWLVLSYIHIGFVPMYCGHSSHCLVPGRMIKAMETSINRRMHNKGLFITSDNSSLYGEEEKKEYERIRDIWENAEIIEVERGERTIIHYSLHSKK